MRWFGRIVIYTITNAAALLAAANFIPGVKFQGDFKKLLVAALIFTALNIFLKPIVKTFLGPLIVLTFGLFVIVINALMLYLLDLWSPELTIEGYLPLLLATLLISALNVVVGWGLKKEN
jgi:putative membrane protein